MVTNDPRLERLRTLAGTWAVEVRHPDPAVSRAPISGSSNFEWALGGAFLVQSLTIEHPDFPEWLAVIGPGDDGYAYRYYDSRGATRDFTMHLSDDSWSLERRGPDFFQHFSGTFTPDGTRIDVRLDLSRDQGRTWTHDFDMTFTKATP
ncbi:hypothetical protein [Glycomyces sp. NRRL B-16210]|uniref:hypothetical protein n=1 Tax=Glycomyces sp. NRRL B-16210 TaxID=1463821 RepID=UPI0006918BCC|nr:hypothetical protein [Glycomyces sp. NRRL B-16210]